MPSDITHSNFPPTPKEETLLRVLLKKKEDELKTTNEQILKARSAVASAKESIKKLTKSRRFACTTIETYETHIKHLRSSLELLVTRLTFVPAVADTESSDPTPCVALHDLLTPDIIKRRENVTLEIEELEQICAKVKASITDINEDIRCERCIKLVNAKSLESYLAIHSAAQSIIDEISGAFRAIKRIPNEIWSDILDIRIAEDSSWFPKPMKCSLFLPALPISHVCRTWRSVVTSSPSMWQAMHWNLSSDDEPSRQCINLWRKMAGKATMAIYENQSNAHTSAAQTLRNHLMHRSKKLIYHVVQYSGDIPTDLNADASPKIPILGLALYAPLSSRNARVQPGIYSQFSAVECLTLSNLLPHRGLALHDSLGHLRVAFSQPHKSYTLARLLIPSLLYLSLQHFEVSGTPVLEEVVQLPNLVVLDITPLEYKIAEKLEMPKLSLLALSSPVKVAASPDGWLDSIVTLCTTVDHLWIDCSSAGKSKKHRDTTGFDVVQILTKLLPQTPELELITLVGAIFEREGLTNLFEKKANKEGAKFRKFKELTIDNCIGVSRMDCERLVQYVEKLTVYRTVHKDDDIQE